MPRRDKYVPKHRGPATEPALRKGVKRSLVLSGVAVAATGIAVSTGVLMQPAGPDDAAAAFASAGDSPDASGDVGLSDRAQTASRSDSRSTIDPVKAQTLSQQSGGQATRTEDLTAEDPRDIARALLSEYGYSSDQFSCLDSLYVSESNWNPHADNPSSSAYGIPQALTGGTHTDLPADYLTNPVSQIEWGLEYIKRSYGTPCAAWAFKQSHSWY